MKDFDDYVGQLTEAETKRLLLELLHQMRLEDVAHCARGVLSGSDREELIELLGGEAP